MKKLLTLLCVSFCVVQSANAKIIKVEAGSDFSTANPPKTWQVIVAEDVETKNGQIIKAGSVFEGDVTDVESPKRLKRDASFVFVPRTFYDVEGKRYDIEYRIEAKYNFIAKLKAKNVVKQGVLTAGNIIVTGIGPAIQAVEGACKNEEGNRLKSAGVAAFDATPLSYYKQGKELEFKKGEVFKMNFTLEDDEDGEN